MRQSEKLSKKLGKQIPPKRSMSSRVMGLFSAEGRDTYQRKNEKKEITPELVGPKTTSLLKK